MSDIRILPQARDLYTPVMAEVRDVRRLTDQETLYEVVLPGGADLGHQPGQFVEVSLFGCGEAPFSVSSSPTRRGAFELGIRRVGMLTEMLERLLPGETMGVRGPFGRGVPLERFRGKDVLIVAGGIGLVPMRSMIQYVLDRREEFGRLIICYGARSDRELLFTDELEAWDDDPSVELRVTVDRGSAVWTGNTGVITTLIPGLDLDLADTRVLVCGPPVMYRFALLALLSRGLEEEQIWMSLERRMKCGVGKCGHCQINGSYVCQDGPVYHYPELKRMQEAL
ncbi:MAG TPA: FAD/NAD(P)-binding protein [Candidatus Krumholzibacteria bacterium]|nr:FAD/NAD(P)-binding protein [Candidatus Krumholzibacteria bacterium]HRX52629.1 FAD/NAD(P)-binding protein [Candidatus Krumholzibacteria bacterium]